MAVTAKTRFKYISIASVALVAISLAVWLFTHFLGTPLPDFAPTIFSACWAMGAISAGVGGVLYWLEEDTVVSVTESHLEEASGMAARSNDETSESDKENSVLQSNAADSPSRSLAGSIPLHEPVLPAASTASSPPIHAISSAVTSASTLIAPLTDDNHRRSIVIPRLLLSAVLLPGQPNQKEASQQDGADAHRSDEDDKSEGSSQTGISSKFF